MFFLFYLFLSTEFLSFNKVSEACGISLLISFLVNQLLLLINNDIFVKQEGEMGEIDP